MHASESVTQFPGRRPLGSTGLEVSAICVGTSPLGSMPQLYGYEVETEQAVSTIQAAMASPFNFLDTSNGYGGGESERRIGAALARAGGRPPDFVLATKVDPDPQTGDFSGARVRASVEESLDRLGLDRLQVLYIHDPERIDFDDAVADDGPVPALAALRDEGLVAHLGVAGGPISVLRRYLATELFDVVLTHNRWTLLDRSAEPLLEDAADRGVAVVNGAPYGGGMLVKGPDAQSRYAYGQGQDVHRDRAITMQEVCLGYGVPLAAAALQFSTREARIASTVVGISAPERIQQTLDLLGQPIPPELWRDLDRLVPAAEHWLG